MGAFLLLISIYQNILIKSTVESDFFLLSKYLLPWNMNKYLKLRQVIYTYTYETEKKKKKTKKLLSLINPFVLVPWHVKS